MVLSCIVIVFGESDAGHRRADPDWSRYTGRRRYGPAVRPKQSHDKQKRLQGHKMFAKRISGAKKNPFSAQYPAKPNQPLGLILYVSM